MPNNIQFLGTQIAVEKAEKFTKKKHSPSLFVENPEVSDSCGIVRYIGSGIVEAKFKVGDKIYYGNKVEALKIASEDLLVMDVENVYAVSTEDYEEENTQNSTP